MPLPVDPAMRVCGALVPGRKKEKATVLFFEPNEEAVISGGTVGMPVCPHVRQVKDAAVLTRNCDGDDTGLSTNGNNIQFVRRQKLRSAAHDLFDGQIRTSLKLQKCSVRSEGTGQQF